MSVNYYCFDATGAAAAWADATVVGTAATMKQREQHSARCCCHRPVRMASLPPTLCTITTTAVAELEPAGSVLLLQ